MPRKIINTISELTGKGIEQREFINRLNDNFEELYNSIGEGGGSEDNGSLDLAKQIGTNVSTLSEMRSNVSIPNIISNYISIPRLLSRLIAPQVYAPRAGIIYVAASNATILPTGNDTTGNGSIAAPYLTLTRALTAIPSTGDYYIYADGTFVENNTGRFILSGNFTLPVVFKPYLNANFQIENFSGSNGVINVRNARANNIQFSGATIRPSTDGCYAVWLNPSSAGNVASNILFHNCTIIQRTWSSSTTAIMLDTNFGSTGIHFSACKFQSEIGSNVTRKPTIVNTLNNTGQININIGFWDCYTTDDNWQAFSNRMSGIRRFTVVRNRIQTSMNHSFLVGTDTAVSNTASVTDAIVYDNDFIATGTNPHGLVFGENATGIAALNRVTSGMQGIVVKGTTNVKVIQNAIHMVPSTGNGSALYPKASANTIFDGNSVIIDNTGLVATGFREGPDGALKSSNTTFKNNYIEAAGSNVAAIVWEGSAGSNGGAISVANEYVLSSNANLGSVRGTTVSNTSTLTAAWGSAGLAGDAANNDSTSIIETV